MYLNVSRYVVLAGARRREFRSIDGDHVEDANLIERRDV